MRMAMVRHRFITAAMAVLMLYSACKLAGIFVGFLRNQEVLAEAQDLYKKSETAIPEEARALDERSEPSVRSRFHSLLDMNEDIVGWVKIADTPIDYPILQAEDNAYYLSRNYRHEETRAGSIFMDFRNDPGAWNRNMILYGHRMKDGSMFGSLAKFLDEDFLKSHRTFSFETIYDSFDVEVFSVYVTTTDFNYIKTEFASDQEYLSFLQEIRERSMYEMDTDVSAADQIVTLSTCDPTLDPKDGRLVVHAKITKHSNGK